MLEIMLSKAPYRCRLTSIFLFAVLVVQLGCATVRVSEPSNLNSRSNPSVNPLPSHKKIVVAVLPLAMGLTQEALEKYPQLVKKSVGLGLYQLTLSAVSDSNRFRVVEIRPENVEAIIRERWLSQSGLMAESDVAAVGHQAGADLVIYGRVYDYAESFTEKITGLTVEHQRSIRIGVQLIATDVATLRQVGLGTAVGHGENILGATRSAVSAAVNILVGRLMVLPE